MAESKAIEAIEFMKDRLRETGLNIAKIILFGSQTNGEATEESDIDIIVISSDFRNKDIFKRARLTKEAEISTIRKFMIPFDILTMTPEEFYQDYVKRIFGEAAAADVGRAYRILEKNEEELGWTQQGNFGCCGPISEIGIVKVEEDLITPWVRKYYGN